MVGLITTNLKCKTLQNSAKFYHPKVRFTKYRKIFNLGVNNTAFYHLCNFCGSAHALTINRLSVWFMRENQSNHSMQGKARLCSALQSQCLDLSDTMRVRYLLMIFNVIHFSLCGKNSSKFHFIAVIFLVNFYSWAHCTAGGGIVYVLQFPNQQSMASIYIVANCPSPNPLKH